MSDHLMTLQLGGPRQWVVVRDYHDGSGLLNIFGPFADEATAVAAIAALQELGLDSRFTAMPLHEVSVGADT